MPIRGYRCEKCGKETEELFWRDYPRSIPCPNCGAKAVYRICDTKYAKLGDRQPKRFKVEFRAGYDPGAGKWFDTQRERNDWLRETDSTYRKDMS